MFLGQILRSLKFKKELKMSNGNQLREYHYIDDDILAIKKILDSNIYGVIELNHGNAIYLKDLATYIYSSFNSLPLLKIGAVEDPINENFYFLHKRPLVIANMTFADTLPAVVKYLKNCLLKN